MIKFDYTRHYNHWHPDTTEHIAQMRRVSFKRVQHWIRGMQSQAMLDVGCGKGYLVGALQEEGFVNVCGVDIDEGQTLAAKQQGLPVEHVTDTVTWLRQRKDTYKVIFCFDVIEHIPLPQQVSFVAALHEALTEGGLLLCTVPNANSSFAARYRYIDYTHSSAFTENSLDFLLYHGGFTHIEVTEDEVNPRMPWLPRPQLRWWYVNRLFRFIRRVEAIAEFGYLHGSRAPLSLNLMGIARKQSK